MHALRSLANLETLPLAEPNRAMRFKPFFASSLVLAIFFSLLCAPAAVADSPKTIPDPKDVLGFAPGASRTIADWTQITDYFRQLDQASDSVTLRTLGKTAEGRDLFVAVISAPENIAHLKRIAGWQRRLADPRRFADARQREEALTLGKAVVAITCSLHSTEIVASQMAMTLAHELAEAKTPETRDILRNVVVLLFPSPNPDGIDVVAEWYRQTLGAKSEGTNPPRPYHRYAGHDNNRDWYMLTQPETQRIVQFWYQEWFPHIVYDIHQQGSFGARLTLPPFYDPPNPNISPLILRQVATLGERMASDVTAAGYKGVLTRALYDTWWHGGLRSSSYFHNAVGLLSEAASARLMSPMEISPKQLTHAVRGLPDPMQTATNFPEVWPGGAWRPEDIARMELIACRSLLTHAARYRRELLENQLRLGEREIERGRTEAPFAYVIPAKQRDPEAAARLVNLLWMQGVEVDRAKLDFELDGRKFAAGDFVIPMAQPFRANVKALLEVQNYPDRNGVNGAAEPPYDITGWTLPLTMGVEVVEARTPPPHAAEPVAALLPEAEAWVNQPTPLASAENPTARLGVYISYGAPEDAGWTRWLLDVKRVPYRVLRDGDLRDPKLGETTDAVVFPEQSPAGIVDGLSRETYPLEYSGGIGAEGVENLKAFVRAGGLVVCLGRASDFAIEKLEAPVRNILKGRLSSEFYCPGAVVGLEVNAAHPTAESTPPQVGAFFAAGGAFAANDPDAMTVVARYAKGNPLRSGWLRGGDLLADQPALVEVKYGMGRITLFGFRPQFRGQSHATFGLFLQSVSEKNFP
jgi:hypothetical protein